MDKVRMIMLLGVLVLCQCGQDDPEPEPVVNNNSTSNSASAYFGCWHEAVFQTGYYDIILTENTSEPHKFELGTNCIPDSNIAAQDIAVMRNDTLILDNGLYEYWCFLVGDTMYYSVYLVNGSVERYIKN